MRKRIAWIDLGKGLTILLVLIANVSTGLRAHVNGSTPFLTFLMKSDFFIYLIIMPIFFALSGAVYRPSNSFTQLKTNILRKLVSLGIPYFVFSCLYVLLQNLSPNGVSDSYKFSSLLFIWRTPISYLWFLQSLFFVFVIVDLLAFFKMNIRLRTTFFILTFLFSVVLHFPAWLIALTGWCLCFQLGECLNHYKITIDMKLACCFIVISLVYLFLIDKGFHLKISDPNRITGINAVPKLLLTISSIGIFQFLASSPIWSYFQRLGRYSLIVYMIHAPVASVTRTLILKAFDPDPALVLIWLLTFAITLIVCECVIFLQSRYSFVNFIFSPQKYLHIS